MSNKIFVPDIDEFHYHRRQTLKYMMPTEMIVTPVNNTLVSDFEQIGISDRRRKSDEIKRVELKYDNITSEQMKIIRRFFQQPEIEWQKGSFWLPILNTDYKIDFDNWIVGQSASVSHLYYMKDTDDLEVGDYVCVMNHQRNYDMREIENIGPSTLPPPHSNYNYIQFSDTAIREGDTDPLPYNDRLNYEVLGRYYDEENMIYPPPPSLLDPQPPWGDMDMTYTEEWFYLDLYPLIKARLYQKPEFPETPSGFDGINQYYNLTIEFEQDLMEAL